MTIKSVAYILGGSCVGFIAGYISLLIFYPSIPYEKALSVCLGSSALFGIAAMPAGNSVKTKARRKLLYPKPPQ